MSSTSLSANAGATPSKGSSRKEVFLPTIIALAKATNFADLLIIDRHHFSRNGFNFRYNV